MEEIKGIIDFMIEVEKLKSIQRQTKPVGLDRYENSAEHSWHVCLSALLLKDFANEPVDIVRVMKMLLIHDLGEIEAGDTVIYWLCCVIRFRSRVALLRLIVSQYGKF
ncbi:phosphohydrolase [Vibrio cholerae]|nr:phosphohydrolase [Vibrio cholerae]